MVARPECRDWSRFQRKVYLCLDGDVGRTERRGKVLVRNTHTRREGVEVSRKLGPVRVKSKVKTLCVVWRFAPKTKGTNMEKSDKKIDKKCRKGPLEHI